MTEFGRALSALLNFAFSYELMKCIKTMLAGSVVALLLLFWQGIQKIKNPYWKYVSSFSYVPNGKQQAVFYRKIVAYQQLAL